MAVGNTLLRILSSINCNWPSFPIQEHGLNYESQPLQPHEIEKMKADPQIIERVLTSYRLMLGFYGLRLIDPDTGLLGMVLPPRNGGTRFRHLNSEHNSFDFQDTL